MGRWPARWTIWQQTIWRPLLPAAERVDDCQTCRLSRAPDPLIDVSASVLPVTLERILVQDFLPQSVGTDDFDRQSRSCGRRSRCGQVSMQCRLSPRAQKTPPSRITHRVQAVSRVRTHSGWRLGTARRPLQQHTWWPLRGSRAAAEVRLDLGRGHLLSQRRA
jgi:hypothetical protein